MLNGKCGPLMIDDLCGQIEDNKFKSTDSFEMTFKVILCMIN